MIVEDTSRTTGDNTDVPYPDVGSQLPSRRISNDTMTVCIKSSDPTNALTLPATDQGQACQGRSRAKTVYCDTSAHFTLQDQAILALREAEFPSFVTTKLPKPMLRTQPLKILLSFHLT